MFKKNLIIGYSISLLLLIGSSVASYISIRSLLSTQELVGHTNEIIAKLESALSVMKDAETGQRGYLLTGDAVYLEPYAGAVDRATLLLNDIRELTTDNSGQQSDVLQLRTISIQRLKILERNIENKKRGAPIDMKALGDGKAVMDNAREIASRMENREKVLLISRTEKLNKFANSTPLFILIASLLAILVTIISFIRVTSDFNKRELLQKQLEKKDQEITSRLNIIQAIAERISTGDYKSRVSDEGKDLLGNLSVSLNKMAESLDYSFTSLSEKEWLQTGIAALNEKMLGEKNLELLTYNAIEFITAYTGSQVGAFYLVKNENTLALSASVGLIKAQLKPEIKLGDGVAGRAALSQKEIRFGSISGSDFALNYSAGSIKPHTIVAVPVFYEKLLKGVIELASVTPYEHVMESFLSSATFNIGTAIHSAKDHLRLQDLLAETQAQSEELQSQHAELENINSELEAQAEKLQASEEELKVQQEELQQSNLELEERSRLLEEKNELILERNLDIQRKAEELALSTRYKSEFLANMSHELRTPLNSILLLSRLLSENQTDNLSDEQVEYATVIQSSGKGLLTLIDEILDLSKIESGKMELQLDEISVINLTDQLKALFSPLARDKGIDFTIHIADNVPSLFETDRLRLEQILRNLVSNALKFTKLGSVTLAIDSDESDISFSVIDTGIGIPKEKHQTIFEAFQQADGSTRRQFGGTGLGLSISRELAKLLGGEIRLKSKEGKGSEFKLILPLEKGKTVRFADNKTTIEQEEISAAPVNGYNQYVSENIPPSIPDDRNNITANDKVILIIEDDTSFATSLLNYTRNKGYKGIVAVRGDEGVTLAKAFSPIGILLDIQLPVKSGWHVMDELKSDPETRPIPVHAMSAHEVRNRSLTQGAVDFINKPVAFEKLGEMFSKIEDALSRHPKKVLIVEENPKHAKALGYFLEGYNVNAEIKNNVNEGIQALNGNEVDCVILDMGIPAQQSYNILEDVKKTPGLENLPIIIFTGKNLSQVEEMKIRKYADSIVIKTANSYQRILDEVSLFLHLVEENKKGKSTGRYKKLGELGEVLKGKTVLIADDDVRNIFSLTRSLESHGINIISAIDGKEALKRLEENPGVDLVLMDMMMPEMDGYESISQIRKKAAYKKLPIIAVTAKAMTGDREKCINAGASDYITKPVDIDQLISLLRVWLYE